jgi:Tfp pilus assembly protein PilW
VSLVELLIVMAIVGVVTTGMYTLFLTTAQTYTDQAVNGRMLQNATAAMKRITQDLRGGGTFFAPACASLPTPATNWPPAVTATANGANSVTIATLLDDPNARTEIATTPAAGQPRTNTTIGVLSVSGWQVNDIAYITDGVQCTRFTVTAVVTGANPGLTHVPANDTYTLSAYTYPVATSMVYRVNTSQTVTYALDTSDPNTTWLTRNGRRIAPDIQTLSFSFFDGSATAVNPAANPANVRAITVNLLVRGDRLDPSVHPNVTGGYRTQRLTSTVQLRNFGS